MSNWKSTECIGRTSGKPLTAYDSRQAAEDGAQYARQRYGHEMTPYQCDRCRDWHLAPADRQTPSSTCYGCAGRDGQPKQAYDSFEAAERRAEIVRDERGVWLMVYACPHGGGWHLTKG